MCLCSKHFEDAGLYSLENVQKTLMHALYAYFHNRHLK